MYEPFVLLIALVGLTQAMRDQSIAVKGKLLCGDKVAANVRIKLWEEDTGPDPDDLLDQGYTDSNGEFKLSGGTAELTPIDPVFKAYHDCDDGIKPGHRKVKFALPKSYITSGKVPSKVYDIGVINLETYFYEEGRDMIISRMRRGMNEDYLDTEADSNSELKKPAKSQKPVSSESSSSEENQ